MFCFFVVELRSSQRIYRRREEAVGAMGYHGYGATDLYRVDEHYGSLED
jgi:glycosidase